MRQLLVDEGFTKYKGCNCSGGRENYKHPLRPGIEIVIFLRHKTFQIKHGYKLISRGVAVQLESEMIRLFE